MLFTVTCGSSPTRVSPVELRVGPRRPGCLLENCDCERPLFLNTTFKGVPLEDRGSWKLRGQSQRQSRPSPEETSTLRGRGGPVASGGHWALPDICWKRRGRGTLLRAARSDGL